MADIIVVGSDIPTGDEVRWYYGGANARIITEDLVEAAGVITLSKKAEYGSVVTRTAAGVMTDTMLEQQTGGAAATDASGTEQVETSAAGTATITATYLDIETTALSQILACKDVSSPLAIKTKSTEVHGQAQELQKTGSAARTFSIEQVDYSDAFMGACFGDLITDSPAAGMTKYTDAYTSSKKLSAVVGKQYQAGVLIKKWIYFGLQISKIDNSHPCADWYARSMDFVVDSVTIPTIVPNA